MDNLGMLVQRVGVVIQITLQEAVRRRLILFLLVCCVLFIGTGAGCTKACSGMQESSMQGQRERVIERIKSSTLPQEQKDQQLRQVEAQISAQKQSTNREMKSMLLAVVYSMIAFWLFLIAGLFTPFLAMNDFEERTHVTILARPITRWQYLLGKFAAILVMLCLNLLILLLAAHGFTYLVLEDFGWPLLRGVAIYLEGLLVFTAMLICLSLLVGRIPAAIVGLIVVCLGIAPAMYMMSGSMAQASGGTQLTLYALGYGLPQFGVNFLYGLSETMQGVEAANPLRKAGINAGPHSLWINALWFLAFCALSVLILRRKELDT